MFERRNPEEGKKRGGGTTDKLLSIKPLFFLNYENFFKHILRKREKFILHHHSIAF